MYFYFWFQPLPSFERLSVNLPPQGPRFGDEWKGTPVRNHYWAAAKEPTHCSGLCHTKQPSSVCACCHCKFVDGEWRLVKNRSEECVRSKVTLLSDLPNLQEQSCQGYHFLRTWIAATSTQLFLCLLKKQTKETPSYSLSHSPHALDTKVDKYPRILIWNSWTCILKIWDWRRFERLGHPITVCFHPGLYKNNKGGLASNHSVQVSQYDTK